MSRTAVIFAGQGAQYVGMGKALYENEALARNWFEKADRTLDHDLSRICFEGPENLLTNTGNAQPGIFLVSWIALKLLEEKCPEFQYESTAGLSLSEFTALTAAGVLTFEQGLDVVRRRGRYMQEACESTKGSMAAIIGLPESETRTACEAHDVEVANLNCPGQIVISGEASKVEAACKQAKEAGAKRALPLTVAGAYHSKLMQSAASHLKTALEPLTLIAAGIPVLSNVTGRPHGSPTEIRELLVDQVTSSVKWEACIRYMIDSGINRFVELGPGTALSGFMKRIDRSMECLNVSDPESLEKTVSIINKD